MVSIGRFNQLDVIESSANGIVLDGGLSLRLLLPPEEVPESCSPGDRISVFIYLNSDGDPVATTRQPLAELGQVAWLEVLEVNQLGAFVDWGLPKDLFIPFAEQQHTLRKGQHTLVKVYLDKQDRLTGSTRLDTLIKDDATGLKVGEKVSLIIADRTELGFKAVINHRSWGLLYGNELFRTLRKGMATEGYIKQLRGDNKVDLTLSKPGFSKSKIDTVCEQIIELLQTNGGSLELSDKSPPQQIYSTFGVSKKIFKQAVGSLYKQRRIRLEADRIHLV